MTSSAKYLTILWIFFLSFQVDFCVSTQNDGISLQCEPNVMISLNNDTYEEYKGSDSVLFLGPTEICDGVTQDNSSECYGSADGSGWRFNLSSPQSCGSRIVYSSENNTLTVEFLISRLLSDSSAIRRSMCGCILVSCIFERESLTVTQDKLTIEEKVITLSGVNETANYTTRIRYTDSTFSNDLSGNQVSVTDTLYLEATVNEANSLSYKIGVKDCFAAQSEVDSSHTYSLIDADGCPLESVTIVKQSDTAAQFSFQSFLWNDASLSPSEQTIYVFCTTVVCAEGFNCTDGMPDLALCDRKRRSIESERNYLEKNHLKIGPLHVKDNSYKVVLENSKTGKLRIPFCNINNGGCQDICINGFEKKSICACYKGRVLNENGYSCTDVQQLDFPKEAAYEIRSESLQDIYKGSFFLITTCVLFIFNLILIAYMILKKNNVSFSKQNI